jgi:hypothetical protein
VGGGGGERRKIAPVGTSSWRKAKNGGGKGKGKSKGSNIATLLVYSLTIIMITRSTVNLNMFELKQFEALEI